MWEVVACDSSAFIFNLCIYARDTHTWHILASSQNIMTLHYCSEIDVRRNSAVFKKRRRQFLESSYIYELIVRSEKRLAVSGSQGIQKPKETKSTIIRTSRSYSRTKDDTSSVRVIRRKSSKSSETLRVFFFSKVDKSLKAKIP